METGTRGGVCGAAKALCGVEEPCGTAGGRKHRAAAWGNGRRNSEKNLPLF